MFLCGFCKTANTGKEKPKQPFPWAKAVAPLAAGAAAYAYLRHPRALSKKAPQEFKALREAGVRHGFTRVHLHEGKKPGPLRKFVKELFRPADRHVHLRENKPYVSGVKTKAVVFDPEETGKFKTKHPFGKTDKTVREIEKSKLHEFHTAKKMGLKLPKTSLLGDAKTLRSGEIAKPRSGSQARLAITAKDIANHSPEHPLLVNFKQTKNVLTKLLRRGHLHENDLSHKLSRHPGYRRWMTEQALKSPHKFVKQPKINIDKEYRVHTLHGQSLGITSSRHTLQFGGKADAEKAAERLLKNVDPKLRGNLLALDVAKDKRGKWHIIETNPGPASGFLTPTKVIDYRGPHALYKAVTGRYAKSSSLLGAGAAAGAAGLAASQLNKRSEK